MNEHNMSERLKILERKNEDLIQDRKLEKFIGALPIEEQTKFKSISGIIYFEGTMEDYRRIMKPFGNTGRAAIIDSI